MSLILMRQTDYALQALTALATHAAGPSAPLSAREIADEYGLPMRLLMNLLKQLHRAGLVGARRGTGGGYWLDRLPTQISLIQVIEVIEGPVKVTPCCDGHEPQPCVPCQRESTCLVRSSLRDLNHLLLDLFGRLTLDDLLHRQVSTYGILRSMEPVVLGSEGRLNGRVQSTPPEARADEANSTKALLPVVLEGAP